MYTESIFEEVERKKQRIEKVTDPELNKGQFESSSMPSRMELHHAKKKKKKGKSNFPLLKVLLTFFILLPISTIVAYTYFSKHTPMKVTTTDSGNEEISYETIDSQKTDTKDTKQTNLTKKQTTSTSSTLKEQDGSQSVKNDTSKNDSQSVKDDSKDDSRNLEQSEKDTQENTSETNHNAEDIQIVQHIVQPKETLFSIAMKYYHSQSGIEKIISENHIVNNEIQVGQTLQIPIAK